MNRSLILNTLRREGFLSRTQLTEISGLSVGAVSQITNELLATHWILEVGEGDYTGGRRQVLLRLNPDAGFAIGIKLMEDRAACAITNLETQVLHYVEGETGDDHTPEAISSRLSALIEQAIDDAGIQRKNIFGVGIGLAGVVYAPVGVVHYSPFFGWKDAPLGELIRQQLGLPVYIENDVNTLTITEQLFGAGRHAANFAVITVGRGIGMGMVIHHQLYQGTGGGVGELGHIVVDAQGPVCNCGNQGCLEAFAADPAVLAYVAQHSPNQPKEISEVIAAADAGDPIAQAAFAYSGRYLGIGIASVINILCPPLIIISGEGVAAGEYRLNAMFEAVKAHVFNGLLDNVEVIVKTADERAWARGAASIVVGKLFESPLLEAQVNT